MCRYYNSWYDKDRATGFKFCSMCGRKLVKNKK